MLGRFELSQRRRRSERFLTLFLGLGFESYLFGCHHHYCFARNGEQMSRIPRKNEGVLGGNSGFFFCLGRKKSFCEGNGLRGSTAHDETGVFGSCLFIETTVDERHTSLFGEEEGGDFFFPPSFLTSAANHCRHAFFCSLYNADLPNVFYFVSPLLSCLCRDRCARFPSSRIPPGYMRARSNLMNSTRHDQKALKKKPRKARYAAFQSLKKKN